MANILITGTLDELVTLTKATHDALDRLGVGRLTSSATAPDSRGNQSITIVTEGEVLPT